MNRSYSKIRHIKQSNLILEKRRSYNVLTEDVGDDPIVIDDQKKKEIRSVLWKELEKMPEFEKHSLGLESHHNETNFLEDLSHKIHTHIDPMSKHMTFEFPNLGVKHNLELDLGLSLAKHEPHNDHHEPKALIPHSFVDVGVKIPLSKIFN